MSLAAQRQPRCCTASPPALPPAAPLHSSTATPLAMASLPSTQPAEAGTAVLPLLTSPPLAAAMAANRRPAGRAAKAGSNTGRCAADVWFWWTATGSHVLSGHSAAACVNKHEDERTCESVQA